MILKQQMRRARLAVVALGLIGVVPAAFAAGTDTNYDTDITNTASVNYSVGGVPQTVIQSSPTGNSNPGVGNGLATTFEVDKRVMFIVEETNGAATLTAPGATGVVTVFRVTNTTNGPQEFGLLADNTLPTAGGDVFGRPDTFNMNTFSYHISAAACSTSTMATPAYAGEAAVTYLPALAEDTCRYVFVRANVPAGTANAAVSTVRLAVTATTTGSNGATVEANSGAADNPAVVDVVLAETGTTQGNTANNGISWAWDQYVVGTLTVTKTASVISDGFSPAGQAKAIPGAVVEYTITVRNNGLPTTAATLTEIIPTNTAYVAGSTTLNGAAVADVSGVMPFVTARAINSPAAASGVLNTWTSDAADNAVVRFRVTIN